jgi:hypothetical protein
MSGKLTKASGYFIVVYGEGWIWPETLSRRASDSRRILGNIMVGIKRAETWEGGWKYALKNGYRVEKVDVFPAGRALLSQEKAND